MTRISKSHNKPSATQKAQPGLYHAVVKKVEEPKTFRPGVALDIFYDLTPVTGGATTTFKERFFTNDNSPRWEDINAVMDAVGVGENPAGFVGCELQVNLAYDVMKGRKFLNVAEYILPDERPDEEGDGSDASDA